MGIGNDQKQKNISMKAKEKFIKHYEKGYMPWVHSKPDFNLVETVKDWKIKPCKTLEVGCGIGTDAIWLAEQGFEITAIDVSPLAIEMAKENAGKSGVTSQFMVKDFLNDRLENVPFDFVFDRGYFHSFKTNLRRKKIAKKIADYLSDEGMWLSLIGSCDSPPRETGPPMRSAKNIVNAVEPYFEIQFMRTSIFGNDQKKPAKIWVCLMKKRKY